LKPAKRKENSHILQFLIIHDKITQYDVLSAYDSMRKVDVKKIPVAYSQQHMSRALLFGKDVSLTHQS